MLLFAFFFHPSTVEGGLSILNNWTDSHEFDNKFCLVKLIKYHTCIYMWLNQNNMIMAMP